MSEPETFSWMRRPIQPSPQYTYLLSDVMKSAWR